MAMWTTARLREEGIGKRRIRTLLAEGQLFRIHRGVYTDQRPSAREVAACLLAAYPRAVLAGRSAIEVHCGVPLTFPLTLEGPRTIVGENFRVVHSRMCSAEVVDGLRVVEPLWAARRCPERSHPMLEAHYHGKNGRAQLAKDRRRMGRIPRDLRACLRECAIGTDSLRERELARELRKQGIYPIHNSVVAGYRFDLELRRWKILIEVDGYTYHSQHRNFILDRMKSNAGQNHGYLVLRFTGDCIRFNLPSVINQIRDAIRRRTRRHPGQMTYVSREPAWKWHWNL